MFQTHHGEVQKYLPEIQSFTDILGSDARASIFPNWGFSLWLASSHGSSSRPKLWSSAVEMLGIECPSLKKAKGRLKLKKIPSPGLVEKMETTLKLSHPRRSVLG